MMNFEKYVVIFGILWFFVVIRDILFADPNNEV